MNALVTAVGTGAAFLGATLIDEHSVVPISTAVVVLGGVWWAGRRVQQFLDGQAVLGAQVAENVKRFTQLDQSVGRLAQQRILDMDLLRGEMAAMETARVLRDSDLREPPPRRAPGRRYRVLLVDDDANDRFLFERLLHARFEMETAGSLAAATELLAHRAFDCVLLDMSLPDEEGKGTTVEEFLRLNPGAVCVVLSGNPSGLLLNRAVQQGAHSYLLKDQLDVEYAARQIEHAIVRKAAG